MPDAPHTRVNYEKILFGYRDINVTIHYNILFFSFACLVTNSFKTKSSEEPDSRRFGSQSWHNQITR
jgi:hypothetical protein